MNLLPAFLPLALVLGASPLAAAQGDGPPEGSPAAQESAPTRASIARQFALSYLDFWSRPNGATLFASPVFYAPRVRFHGKAMRPSELMAEKQRFVRRWPVRRYEPRLDTLTTTCRGDVCTVRTSFDFSAAAPARGTRSRGRGDLELAIRFAGRRPYIVAETSRVTLREASPRERSGTRPPLS
jgi:hypothetical protein